MKTMIYTDESGLAHDTGPSHPECAERLRVIQELLSQPPYSSLPRGTITPAAARDALLPLLPAAGDGQPDCNGYWHRIAGMERQP